MALVGVVAVLGAGVVGAYVALGGGDYTPLTVADPCQPREWRAPEGSQEWAEQVALSALDGAACDLGISRERAALAISSEEALTRFMAERGIDDARVEEALRKGLLRAVDDGERAGAWGSLTAGALRLAIPRLPVDRLLESYREGRLPELIEGLIRAVEDRDVGDIIDLLG